MHTDVMFSRNDASQAIASWLMVCCAMIFLMVILGGATRLTHSGLSMVEWKPITGLLPPLDEQEWQATFEKYQQYPEFQKLNKAMDLAGFKSIFWYEFTHRLLGRLIGLVFLVPMLVFLLLGKISQQLFPKLILMFFLGGMQGFMGWYMVKSGLVDKPDVSQYRLTAHLALAFLVYGYIFWVALGLLHPRPHHMAVDGRTTMRPWVWLLGALIFITILSGGFVAGLDAGFAYNTFPLMNGQLIPDGIFMQQPLMRNFFENIITVQFNHRVLAIVVFFAVAVLWFNSLRTLLPRRTHLAFNCLMAAALLQVILGISTLVLAVPVRLGIAHQAGALMLFTTVIWLAHELRGKVGVL